MRSGLLNRTTPAVLLFLLLVANLTPASGGGVPLAFGLSVCCSALFRGMGVLNTTYKQTSTTMLKTRCFLITYLST